MMVIDPSAREVNESVFTVFATRARQRSSRSLAWQLIGCALIAVVIVPVFPAAWPVAAALGAAACYGAWALLDRRPPSRFVGVTMRALAALAFALALSVGVGLALAAFTGDGRSPYGMCYDENERAFACDAKGRRR